MFFWILLVFAISGTVAIGFYTCGDPDAICASLLFFTILAVAIAFCTGLLVAENADWEYQFAEERIVLEQSDGIYFETIVTDNGSLTCKYDYKTEFGIVDDTIDLYDTSRDEFYRNPVKDGEAPTIKIYRAEYINQDLKHWFWFCGSPNDELDRIIVNYNKDMVKEYKSCLD